jgi:glucosamine-6-phosphate deaminase
MKHSVAKHSCNACWRPIRLGSACRGCPCRMCIRPSRSLVPEALCGSQVRGRHLGARSSLPDPIIGRVEVLIVNDIVEGSNLVGGAIARLLAAKPDAVLGLATGSTPEGVYADLARRHHEDGLSFARAHGFALDEYVGLPADHPESYRSVLQREIVGRVDFSPGAVQSPNGWASDIPAACAEYESAIRASGGIDLQILGVGTDGHIGFNEPTSSLASLTRVKSLTEQTRADNARFFDDDISQVPNHVLTQGVGTIRRAKHPILLAWGAGKADAIAATVEGPVSAMVPSTALQLVEHATVVVDDAAASKLKLADYYRVVYNNKPDWQGL